MASTNRNEKLSKTGSSFDAFSKVDELVSKPVLGSDGAASWQSFRNVHQKANSQHHRSAAPKAPLKRADKLGTGFSTWEEERAHEQKIRENSGHAKTNSGYTVFNKKDEKGVQEAMDRKRKAQIEARIRPDDKEYFIPSKLFQGWKFDYVFTTRNDPPRTGYFWDGMDTIKKENGELNTVENLETNVNSSPSNTRAINDDVSSKSKKKRKKNKTPLFKQDPTNPMEQVQAIIQKRNQQLMGITIDPSLPIGWEAAKDPSTGKTYYYHRKSGSRSWDKPQIATKSSKEKLPMGWKSAVDQASGNKYYHHTSGKTTWTKPE